MARVLTENGVIEALHSRGGVVLQMLNPREMVEREGVNLIRVDVSDGKNWARAFIYNEAIKALWSVLGEGRSPAFLVVRATQVMAVKENIIIQNLQLVDSACTRKIGDPQRYRETAPKHEFQKTEVKPAKALGEGFASLQLAPVFIGSLHPDMADWRIIGRVTLKSGVKTFQKKGRGCKALNFHVLGRDNFEIKCTAYDQVVDRLDQVLVVGQVYSLSNGKICQNYYLRQSDYFRVSSYSLVFSLKSEVFAVPDDGTIRMPLAPVVELPQAKDYFNQLITLRGTFNGLKARPYEHQFRSKKGVTYRRRVLTICDPAARLQAQLTLWFELAEKHRDLGSVKVELTHVKVSEYQNNLAFGSTSLSTIKILQPVDDFLLEGICFQKICLSAKAAAKNYLPSFCLYQVREEIDKSLDSKEIVFEGYFYIRKVSTRGPKWYSSCPFCRKKVDETGTKCFRCNRQFSGPRHRFILNVEVADHSGNAWLTFFDAYAESLFARAVDSKTLTCQEARLMQETQLEERFKEPSFSLREIKVGSRSELGAQGRRRQNTVLSLGVVEEEARAIKNLVEINKLLSRQ